MNDEQWQRIRALFAEAQDLSAEAREAFLDRELAGEPELRTKMETLLAHADSAGSFLIDPQAREKETGRGALPEGISAIGPYHILHLLGEGGFGVVYLAEQLRPIRRRVALKLIKPGMDTKHVIARFEAERQSLALMDHRGIAQVFDAGETEAGRPYFAMEYVDGIPITAFCDRERFRVRERLELFLQACDAVQHAHQKGVIHRDIKPSNVLVTLRDGVAALKVIDFGIVKATSAALDDRSFVTSAGAVLGTLGYMSPEQTGAIDAVVDTRSDIYSLGILLYELLAGELPFDRERLRRAAGTEAVRVLREEEPPSLTARVARVAVANACGSPVAERRSVDERTLLRQLKGELEWITHRALERDPDRRYPSASDLSADIRRHLANEPVLARAPSPLYRVSKFAQRHRVGVAAAALVLASIVAGGVAAGIGFARAVRAEHTARREADSARRVADFLVELFETADPNRSRGETVTARTLLDQGTRRIQAHDDQDPHVRARLLTTLGDAHVSLGLYDEGLALLRDALATSESAEPRDEREVAAQLRELAAGLRAAGKTDSVEALLERAIAIASERDGPRSAALAAGLSQMAELRAGLSHLAPADSLARLAIELFESQASPDTLQLVRAYLAKGRIAHRRGAMDDAERAYLRGLELSESIGRDPNTSAFHSQLAAVYNAMHEPEKAVSHARESVRLARQLYAPEHPSIAIALGGEAAALTSKGDYEQASVAREEALRILRANGGRDDLLCVALNGAAILYRGLGKVDLAIARAEEASVVARRMYGMDNARTAENHANLGRYYAASGQLDRADSVYQLSIPVLHRLDTESLQSAYAHMGYANLCRDIGRRAEADSVYARAEAMMDTAQAAMRPYVVECLVDRGYLRAHEGRYAAAESLMQRAFALARRDGREFHSDFALHHLLWAGARARAGNTGGAIEALRDALRCGAKRVDVSEVRELASLRSRSDYPDSLR
jgi:eukaryotic-like serine/threonine-protein kinase